MNIQKTLLFFAYALAMGTADAEQLATPTPMAVMHQHNSTQHEHNHNNPDTHTSGTIDARQMLSVGMFALEILELPKVKLIDQEARRHDFPGPLTDQRLLVINFTYTHCETICPIGNQIMARLDDALDADLPVTLLSISLDPARDSVQRLNSVAQAFGASSRWYWLGGEVGEVQQLLAAFDADQPNLELHDPIFLVGSLASGKFYRSQSIPVATELVALVESIAL